MLFGDANNISLEAIGGLNAGFGSGKAEILFNEFTFGNDVVDAGVQSGEDILYGDIKTLTLIAVDGSGVKDDFSGEAPLQLNSFSFGDDQLIGSDGNNVLVGDFEDITMVANVINIETIVDKLSITDQEDNTFIFGNDQLTGGSGQDTFVFSLLQDTMSNMIMQGNDRILDFEFTALSNDTLEFRDVIDVDSDFDADIFDLEAVTVISPNDIDNDGLEDVDGDGFDDDLLIQFDADGVNAGSIALINYATAPNAPTLSATPTIVDLISVIDIV